ncbi:hypothetical protein [Paracoccus sp. T5]|uniref:hypothetical protein n=1 Tax=Paracoccus sp. T5 TaxID=3402161 RepID=UPI003AE2B767
MRGSASVIFGIGVLAGLAIPTLLRATPNRHSHGPRDSVRDAGPGQMKNPPADWDEVDEAVDESFPASDPPSTY